MRTLPMLLALTVLAMPVVSQTTGVPGANDLTINGIGSGGTSCVDPGLRTGTPSIAFHIQAAPGDLVFGVQALSGLCVPNALVIDPTYSADIDTATLSFFLPSSIALPVSGIVNGAGQWALSFTCTLPASLAYAIQFALVGPGFSTGIGTTQAFAGTITAPYPVYGYTFGGDLPGLSDDGSINLVFSSPGGFTFYGVNYASVFVNMNGNLTFGAGDTDWTSSEAEMLSQEPRIAPTWDDWTPNDPTQGTVRASDSAAALTVEWFDVRHFGCGGVGDTNTFGAQLIYANMAIEMRQGNMLLCGPGTAPSTDQVVGISPGGGLSLPNNLDLTGGAYGAVNPNDAIYEDFALGVYGPYDLGGATATIQVYHSLMGTGPYVKY